MGKALRRLSASERKAVPGGSQPAFITPLIIPVILLLILGAVTLASRSTNSFLASTKQSDAKSAREAAESGMDRVISALNPFSKSPVAPYLSFLLASNWQAGTGVDGSGWRLTNLSRADVQSLLRQCGLSTRGMHANNLPPDGTQVYRDIFTNGSIGTQSANTLTQLRYRVTNYVPPPRSLDTGWPTQCADFSSISGGSAQITVEGTVVRGNLVVARFTLTRTLDVQGWPLPDLPAVWMDSTVFPGPPLGLRISGVGSNLIQMTNAAYIRPTDATFTALARNNSTMTLPQCRSCTTNATDAPSNGVEVRITNPSDLFPANDADLPRFPFDTDSPPSGLTPQRINISKSNFPFTSSTPALNSLEPGCRSSEDINSQRRDEIDCWIDLLGTTRILRASRAGNRVTLTLQDPHGLAVNNSIVVNNLSGNYSPLNGSFRVAGVPSSTTVTYDTTTSSDIAEPTSDFSSSPAPLLANAVTLTVNTQIRPVNLILLNDVGAAAMPVAIKHAIASTAQGPTLFDHTNSDTRRRWSRLRLFGRKPASTACTNAPGDQTLYIRADPADPTPNSSLAFNPASLGGAFVWLPRGTLVYGSVGTNNTVAPTPAQLMGSWWVCNLTLNLSRGMTLIWGLHGNHDEVASILPGGYLNSAGAFVPDLRFPVYPQLMRIRSLY